MLRELHISNLAVIADARIELHPGLNCFTGATGAGKSLVIGAVEVLLGLRSPAEMLRTGVDEGRVSGVFEIRSSELLKKIEAVTDVPVTQEGGELLLTRRLYASGRSSISLNGNPITLGMLKQVAEHLVDVHGQHDHQFLLKPSNQLDVLDQFGELGDLRRRYHEVYLKLQDARQRLEDLTANRTLREQQLDLYRFQADEIDKAEIDAAEYEELQARSSVLHNLEKLKKDTSSTYSALYDADGSVLERLKMMVSVLAELSDMDQNLSPITQSMRDATIALEEVAFDLSRYLDRLDLDPAESVEVDDRLNTINRVLNKYGGTVEETLAYRQEIGQKLAELERATDDFSTLDKQIPPLEKELKALGTELSEKRRTTAARLAPLIEAQLVELGMEKACFFVQISPTADGQPQPSGLDQVEFMAQTNPGLTPQPLRKIASGGELSRIMLALKSILADSDRISVLVFDEIDANVGGEIAGAVGRKMAFLGDRHQVVAITHMPQVAALAHRHFLVTKEVENDTTNSRLELVTEESRIRELARMLGGVGPETLALAEKMLEKGEAPAARS